MNPVDQEDHLEKEGPEKDDRGSTPSEDRNPEASCLPAYLLTAVRLELAHLDGEDHKATCCTDTPEDRPDAPPKADKEKHRTHCSAGRDTRDCIPGGTMNQVDIPDRIE